MGPIAWAAVVAGGWLVLNLVGTIVNRAYRFIWVEQSGDVAIQPSSSRSGVMRRSSTRTSGKLSVSHPRWLAPAVRALNNMRAQAPYLAAMMALAWWIKRMWF